MLRGISLHSFLRAAGIHWASYLVGLVTAMATVLVCINVMSARGSTVTITPTLGFGIQVIFISAYLALVFGPMDFTIRRVTRRFIGRFSAHVLSLSLCLASLAAFMLGLKSGVTEIAVLGTGCFLIGGFVGGLTRAVLTLVETAPATS